MLLHFIDSQGEIHLSKTEATKMKRSLAITYSDA